MYLRVHVLPGSKREVLTKESDDTWRVSVREEAERNQANQRVRELIAEELGISVSAVRILTGHHSRSKLMSIDID